MLANHRTMRIGFQSTSVFPWKTLLLLGVSIGISSLAAEPSEDVTLVSLPENGIQPKVLTGEDGVARIVYFQGEAGGGDLFFAVQQPGEATFANPMRVNSTPGTAVATGTIRGAQIAADGDGRIHVIWNGAVKAKGDRPPLYYTRSNPDGTGFEKQRPISGNWLMDGGGAVAADGQGGVFVFFHGGEGHGEEGRKVFVRISTDHGETFEDERAISPEGLGVCACCGMQAFADGKGRLFVIYRTASEGGRMRDIATLFSSDGGRTWKHEIIDRWEITQCPMSSMSITGGMSGVTMAWEREGQIYLGRWDEAKEAIREIRALPGAPAGRKHPSLGADRTGDLLVAWTEGTGWNRGGEIAWQRFDGSLRPKGAPGRVSGLPVWSFVSVVPKASGFAILR